MTDGLRVVEGGGGLYAWGVGKTYKRRAVVHDVSVHVRRGEAVGLLGPNGAGKTTTFYMIVGLVRPATGTIRLAGAAIPPLPMYHPAYLLLDEPLAGIDPIAVGEIRDLIGHLKDRGIGVLITDHNVREALEIIDRAYIMHDGEVLMEGAPHEVVAHEDVRRVYLGERFSL